MQDSKKNFLSTSSILPLVTPQIQGQLSLPVNRCLSTHTPSKETSAHEEDAQPNALPPTSTLSPKRGLTHT